MKFHNFENDNFVFFSKRLLIKKIKNSLKRNIFGSKFFLSLYKIHILYINNISMKKIYDLCESGF